MSKRSTVVVNLIIVCILTTISVVVFTTNFNNVFLTVSAPLSNGNRQNQSISFMVQLGGHTPYAEPLVDIFKERGVGATFFLDGGWATMNLSLLSTLASEFEIGNGGQDILQTHKILGGILDYPPTLFHPNQASVTRQLLRTAQSMGYTTVLPSQTNLNSTTFRRGDLVLITPCITTLATLPTLVDHFLTQGYNIIPVGEILV